MAAPYDPGVVKLVLVLLIAAACASPMSAVKDENRRLAQTVSELRAERRAQERRLRDLQRQLDLARAQLVTGAVPDYPGFLERSKTTHPLGRVGQPEEVAAAVLFLMSAEAGWVTGVTFSIDGGRALASAR